MNQPMLDQYALDDVDYFFGVINKASYRQRFGSLTFEPRWKSEYRKQTRGLFSSADESSLTEIVSALVEIPVMNVTMLQAGIEYMYFNDLENDTRDFNSVVGAVQFSNESDYLGYRLRALVGMSLQRKDYAEQKAQLTSQSFITIFAGLN